MKCFVCGNLIRIYIHVLWCDDCIDECLAAKAKGETMEEFVARKRKEVSCQLFPGRKP